MGSDSEVRMILSKAKVKGAYIKYVGVGNGGFYKFFKKKFVAQEIKDLPYFF